ncbi:GH25 family lysozyme, partial [Ralstonia pseudosolanacearum]|uniref:GH25 family lysozyme n=1 Tax=Ralstonia pseudosolanacearum TaxID=1310165 RepID=UPI003D165C5E
MKATEGVRFKDNKMPIYANILSLDKIMGFYHFARPDLGNDPEDEALHFINYIRNYISDRSFLA